MTTKLILVFLSLVLSTVNSARILAVLPLGGKSHHRMFQPIMRTLAQAGHEVVVYSPFPLDNPPPNYTDVHLENISLDSEEISQVILEITEYPQWMCLDMLWSLSLYDELIGDLQIKKLLATEEKFDLIITEPFTNQEFTLILSMVFKVPIIGLQAFFTNNLVNSYLGNSLSLSYIPDACMSLSNNLSFFQRMYNAFASLRGLYYHYYYYIPKLENKMRLDFPDMPPLIELAQNVSLMFVNDHLTADYAQPRPPNIIPVAGIHIESSKPLPQGLQRFMDDSTEGVIFFSLGTYVPDQLQPKEYFDMYINVFKKLRQRVLWKTQKENIVGLPANVMTMKWAPQPDILAHPNCVLFITHGGLLSQHEAVHFGVPVISIPQFFDQHRNSKFYEEHGIGVMIPIKDISEATMKKAIYQVLSNPSYRDNMKRVSQIFRDRPLSPAESVVFWTEYVLRHGGAGHLRPASTRLRWYQRALLDVLSVLLAVIISIILIIYFIVRKVTGIIYLTRDKSTTPIKKYKYL